MKDLILQQKNEQLEKENICLKRRLMTELKKFNKELEKQKLTNISLRKQLLQLRQRNAFLEMSK